MTATFTTPRTWVASELVTAALLNTHLRDMMDYFLTPNSFVVTDTSDRTTTSTSVVDVNAALSDTLETHGGHVLIGLSCVLYVTGATTETFTLYVDIDGTDYLLSQGVPSNGQTGISSKKTFHLWVEGLSAATHTIKLQWSISANTIHMDGSYVPTRFWAVEV